MRKSIVFISAVLTTFALVMLYRVASAYRESSNVEVTTVPPATMLAATATELPPTSIGVVLAPEEAAQLATQVVGNSNLLSAESATIEGVDAYKITFTNNDVVYIGLDGQVLSVQVAPVVVNIPAPVKEKNKNNNSNNASSNGEEDQNHEDHEEHEEDEENED